MLKRKTADGWFWVDDKEIHQFINKWDLLTYKSSKIRVDSNVL